MIGHEGVRRLTEAHLIELLPGFLSEVRAQVPPVDVDNEPPVWPPDPHVMCADEFPDRSDKLPSVIVTSAELLGMKAEEGGACTEWTPLHGRGRLFREELDESDPWQFSNVRVD